MDRYLDRFGIVNKMSTIKKAYLGGFKRERVIGELGQRAPGNVSQPWFWCLNTYTRAVVFVLPISEEFVNRMDGRTAHGPNTQLQ